MYSSLFHYSSFEYIDTREHYDEITPSSVMKHVDHIFYINLDKRTDRKEAIEKQLKEYGLPFERFSAISDPFGAVGCSKSHLAVIQMAKQRGYKRVMILEDDFTFIVSRSDLERSIEQITSRPFDVCMLAYNGGSHTTPEPFWKKITYGLSTSGYIVNSSYYDTLLEAIIPSIPLLKQTQMKHAYAIDVIYTHLQPKGNWYCTDPRSGVQAPSYSDIEERHVNYGV
jgi:glycosyl transferase family 25